MCRPSCCKKPPDQGGGIAVVAVIAAVVVAAKIGPAVARIWHIAVEAVTIFTLTCAAAVTVILVSWAVTRIIGSCRAHRPELPHPVWPAARQHAVRAGREPGCLACGGTGTVLRAITASDYRADPCPVCDPAERAG